MKPATSHNLSVSVGFVRTAGTQKPPAPPGTVLRSSVCKAEHFDLHFYWVQVQPVPRRARLPSETVGVVFICPALLERDPLNPRKRGVWFGVGRERLAAVFEQRMFCLTD